MPDSLPENWTDKDQDDLENGLTSWDTVSHRKKPSETPDYSERLRVGFRYQHHALGVHEKSLRVDDEDD